MITSLTQSEIQNHFSYVTSGKLDSAHIKTYWFLLRMNFSTFNIYFVFLSALPGVSWGPEATSARPGPRPGAQARPRGGRGCWRLLCSCPRLWRSWSVIMSSWHYDHYTGYCPGDAGLEVYGAGDDPLAALSGSIPGVPGEDYPIYAEVPETAFSCEGQVDGGENGIH